MLTTTDTVGAGPAELRFGTHFTAGQTGEAGNTGRLGRSYRLQGLCGAMNASEPQNRLIVPKIRHARGRNQALRSFLTSRLEDESGF